MTTSKHLPMDPAPVASAVLLCALLAMAAGCDKGGSAPGTAAPADDSSKKAGAADAPGGQAGAQAGAKAAAAQPCAGPPSTDGLPAGARLRIDAGRPVLALAFTPDGVRLATGDAQGEVCLRDVRGTGDDHGRRLGAHEGPVSAVALLADGSRVVSAGADGTLRIWDVAAGNLLHSIDQAPAGKRRGQPPAGHTPAALLAVAAAPQGDHVVSGGWDGRVRLWSGSTGALVREVATLPFAVVDVAFSPDGAFIAAASEAELEAHVFDAATGKRVSRASGYVESPVGVAFASVGARLVSVDRKGGIVSFVPDEPGTYDAGQYHPLSGAGAFAGPAHAMALASDGTTLLVGGEGAILVAGVTSGQAQERAVLAGHSGPVAALAVAPDGGTAASAGGDGHILLWSLDAGGAGGNAGQGAGADAQAKGAIPDAYRTLVAAGCDVARAGVATPIEARVLRNVPYALAGKPFESQELTFLFRSDGSWYQPGVAGAVELEAADAACVAALKKHENELRKRASLDRKVEAVLTGSAEIFLGLRALGIPGLRLGKGEQRSTEDQTYWVAPCSQGCQEVEMLCDVAPGTGNLDCRVTKS